MSESKETVMKEEAKPQFFTYVNSDEGVQKEWPVEAISVEAGIVINHVQQLQNKLAQMNLEAGDINAAIEMHKAKLPEMLPSDDMAVITKLEEEEKTEH